jgi:hypothetical protein
MVMPGTAGAAPAHSPTVSLGLLPSATSSLTEFATVILSNGLAGIVRFVLLRTWVFNPRRARW